MAFLNNIIYNVMAWIYNAIAHDYILTIILATIALKLITLPFDIKQRKESQKMQLIQPELKLLQKKYANDAQKLNQKTSELYKTRGVSPFMSCLPMLITLPVLFAFFGGLRLWADEISVRTALEISSGNLAYLDQFKWAWINNVFQPDSGMASVVQDLKAFTTLMESKNLDTRLFMLTPDVLQSAKALVATYETAVFQPATQYITANAAPFVKNMLSQGGYVSNGWFVLPLLSGATMILSMWLTSKNTAAGTPGMGKTMNIVMAAMAIWFCVTSSAVFAMYWTMSNVTGILTQVLLSRLFKPAGGGDVIEGEGTSK